jgi:hypothetical protein
MFVISARSSLRNLKSQRHAPRLREKLITNESGSAVAERERCRLRPHFILKSVDIVAINN